MDFRFVHAADLHLDSPFKGVTVDEGVRALLQESTFRAFRRIVDVCLSEKAAFLLLAGDLFDAKDRSVRARVRLAQELARLDGAGVQTFIVHGNHDPLLPDRAPGTGLPPSVKVFGPDWEEVEVRRSDRVLCRVQGVSYPEEKVTGNLALRFGRRGDEFTIGLLHANLGGESSGHANYAPCSLADLGARGLDYWALGHVHQRAVHALPAGGLAVYPGNCQGRHVNEDGPRGCAVVHVRDGRADVRFIDVDVVRWHRLQVDITGIDSVEALSEALAEELAPLSEVQGPEAHAVRITLVGRGPLHRELARPGALEDLEQTWREDLLARTPRWVLESVRDETASELDFEVLRREGGLIGAVLDEGAAALEQVDVLWEDPELERLEARLRSFKLASPRASSTALIDLAAKAVAASLAEGAEKVEVADAD